MSAKFTVAFFMLILPCLSGAQALSILFPDSRNLNFQKNTQINKIVGEKFASEFLKRINASPVKKYEGNWGDGGMAVIFLDKNGIGVKAFRVFDFTKSKGVFIECEILKSEHGVLCGEMKFDPDFTALTWPNYKDWLVKNGGVNLVEALKK